MVREVAYVEPLLVVAEELDVVAERLTGGLTVDENKRGEGRGGKWGTEISFNGTTRRCRYALF